MKSRWKIYLSTILLWALLCLLISLWQGYQYIHDPVDQDFYAHNWEFVGLVFCIFKFPLWLAVLSVIIGIEMLILNRSKTCISKEAC